MSCTSEIGGPILKGIVLGPTDPKATPPEGSIQLSIRQKLLFKLINTVFK